MTRGDLLKALIEAADWKDQMSEFERTKIPHYKAKEAVMRRIFDKYAEKIKPIHYVKNICRNP